jgi:hypothetical protein
VSMCECECIYVYMCVRLVIAASHPLSTPYTHTLTLSRYNADIVTYLDDSRRVLRAISRWFVGCLNDAGIATNPVEGGFYVMHDFGKHRCVSECECM